MHPALSTALVLFSKAAGPHLAEKAAKLGQRKVRAQGYRTVLDADLDHPTVGEGHLPPVSLRGGSQRIG
jgi:hypothetical protein